MVRKETLSEWCNGVDWLLLSPDMEQLSRFFILHGKRALLYIHVPYILELLVFKSRLLSCNKAAPLRKPNEAVPFIHAQISFHMSSVWREGKALPPYHCKPESVPCVHLQRMTLDPSRLVHAWKVLFQMSLFKPRRACSLCCAGSSNMEPCYSSVTILLSHKWTYSSQLTYCFNTFHSSVVKIKEIYFTYSLGLV